jgi:hypothetical protein
MYATLLEYLSKIACNFKQEFMVIVNSTTENILKVKTDRSAKFRL